MFGGLQANTTGAHIHCCTAAPGTGTAGVVSAVPAFSSFPLGVTSGTFDYQMDLLSTASYNPAYFGGPNVLGNVLVARDLLLAGLNNGTAYLNIHTTMYPAGEIRGFITTVPEPSTYALMGAGMLALWVPVRRRATRRRSEGAG